MSIRATIEGRLSADADLRYSAQGTAVCTVTIPDQKRKKNQQTGEWENASDTTWIRATVFNEAGEALAEVAKKGAHVIATGNLITREYETKSGERRQSLELDYAKVALVPEPPRADRDGGWSRDLGRRQQEEAGGQGRPSQGGWGQSDPASDPLATQGQEEPW